MRHASGICIFILKIEFMKGNLDVFSTLFNFSREFSVVGQSTSLEADLQQWESSLQQRNAIIVLCIRHMSGICILFEKIEFMKGNLDVFPTLFNFFPRNFCRGPTSL